MSQNSVHREPTKPSKFDHFAELTEEAAIEEIKRLRDSDPELIGKNYQINNRYSKI